MESLEGLPRWVKWVVALATLLGVVWKVLYPASVMGIKSLMDAAYSERLTAWGKRNAKVDALLSRDLVNRVAGLEDEMRNLLELPANVATLTEEVRATRSSLEALNATLVAFAQQLGIVQGTSRRATDVGSYTPPNPVR